MFWGHLCHLHERASHVHRQTVFAAWFDSKFCCRGRCLFQRWFVFGAVQFKSGVLCLGGIDCHLRERASHVYCQTVFAAWFDFEFCCRGGCLSQRRFVFWAVQFGVLCYFRGSTCATCAKERATSIFELCSPPGSIPSFVVEADVCPSGGLFLAPFILRVVCYVQGELIVSPARASEPRLLSNCIRRLV